MSERRKEPSIEIAQGEVVFVEAKEVTEFMEVGGADFLGKDLRIPCSQVPEIPQVEDDAGRGIGGAGIGFEPAGALKKPKEVGFEALVENRLVGNVRIERDHGFGGRTEFVRKAGAEALDSFDGDVAGIVLQRTQIRIKMRGRKMGTPIKKTEEKSSPMQRTGGAD